MKPGCFYVNLNRYTKFLNKLRKECNLFTKKRNRSGATFKRMLLLKTPRLKNNQHRKYSIKKNYN